MKITLLVDNIYSWYYPFAIELHKELSVKHEVCLVHKASEVLRGDCAFYLSCETIIKKDVRQRNRHNLVVHSSPLPAGKGWSPLSWQILEGKNEIVSTLFEAVDKVDAGDIYFQDTIIFDGSELIEELHEKQGRVINSLVKKFVKQYPNISAKKQEGTESFYAKRFPESSELDVNKTIAEQFNLLRVVDNERYPAFFKMHGHKYIIKIYKDSVN